MCFGVIKWIAGRNLNSKIQYWSIPKLTCPVRFFTVRFRWLVFWRNIPRYSVVFSCHQRKSTAVRCHITPDLFRKEEIIMNECFRETVSATKKKTCCYLFWIAFWDSVVVISGLLGGELSYGCMRKREKTRTENYTVYLQLYIISKLLSLVGRCIQSVPHIYTHT